MGGGKWLTALRRGKRGVWGNAQGTREKFEFGGEKEVDRSCNSEVGNVNWNQFVGFSFLSHSGELRCQSHWNQILDHPSGWGAGTTVFHRENPLTPQERAQKHPDAPRKDLFREQVESLLSQKVNLVTFPGDLGIPL